MNELKREVGIGGAVMMGLGSIVGTGVFVSIGIAAGVVGPAVIAAIVVAAIVAACNGLSSAQLAANHPVSGGTYEYGYRWLHPRLGFTAGWMFLCAKSASAATAALGLAGYTLNTVGLSQSDWRVPLALAVVGILTLLVLTGIRRSNFANIVIVSLTLAVLLCFIVGGTATAWRNAPVNLFPFFEGESPFDSMAAFLQASALMFVAYTGYGRIATLGEEVREPRTTIPKAIIVTLVLTSALYFLVGLVAIAASGSTFMTESTVRQAAPLEVIASQFGIPLLPSIIAFGAVTAMTGVLLNLILGLSRVALAMGRRGDVPRLLGYVNPSTSTPSYAVIAVGILIALITLLGNVKTTWSFSAFTVLIYYALTNLAALRLTDRQRLYPKSVSWIGLLACLSLAFGVEPITIAFGTLLIVVGLLWQIAMHRLTDGPSK